MAAKSKSPKATKAVKALKSPSTPKVNKASKYVKTHDAKIKESLKTGLDPTLVERAVKALLKYHEKQSEESDKTALLGNDRALQLQFTLLRTPGRATPKPIRVLIPHPLYKLADKDDDSDSGAMEEPEICLIVKEEAKPWCQKMIDEFPEHMGCVKKVLGLQSLRKKHARYEQRRELMSKYNFFMADERILPMLSKALGKDFYKAKKLPIPINLTRKEALPFAIQKALSATYMTVSTGTCVMIRAGTTAMSAEKLAENIVEIAKNAVPKMPHKWANIQQIAIKTPESMALPVYSKTPEVLREIAKLAGIVEDIESPEKEEEEEDKADKEADNEKKRDMKSPLLRALKKHKQEEEKKSKVAKSPKEKSKRKSSDVLEPKTEVPAEEDKPIEKETPKQKKRRTSVEASKKEEPEKGSGKKVAKKEKEAKTPESSKKTTKKAESAEKSAPKKQANEFMAAKKFKGSKKGYVFRMGKQGVGYYVDVKPVVDHMALEAITRMKKNNRRNSGGKKKGGRRSF